MTKQIGIYNFATGEDIVRDMTSEELAQYQSEMDEIAAQEQEKIAKETQRIALLAKMGITQEEANLLLGITQVEEKPAIG